MTLTVHHALFLLHCESQLRFRVSTVSPHESTTVSFLGLMFQCVSLNLAPCTEQEGIGGTWKSAGLLETTGDSISDEERADEDLEDLESVART